MLITTGDRLFYLNGHGAAYAILIAIFFLLFAFVTTSSLIFVHGLLSHSATFTPTSN